MDKKSLSSKIEGSRIFLKKHDEALASDMFSYVEKDRERLGQFLPWVPFTKTVEDEVNYIKHTQKCWAEGTLFDYGIFRKSDGLYLGNIGLHSIRWESDRCEVGYWILGDFEGQGYMSEALRILEAHTFESGFHRIEVRCSSINQRSASVPVACGYFFDGVLKENSIEHSKYRHTYIFSKLRTQYLADSILPKTEMDLNAVIKIAKQLPQHFTKKGVEFIESDFPNQSGLIFRHKDRVVGFILYFSNQGQMEIGWMGVSPEFQRKGIGNKLIYELKKLATEGKQSSVIVKTLDESVDYKPYEMTRSFYLKNGFKKDAVISHPDNPECEKELILKMELK